MTVTDTVAGRDGVDTLSRMEFLGFSDETISLVNKAPTAPAFVQPVRLEENADLHTAVGTIRAGDAEGDALTYTLLDDAGGHFAIDPATGVLTLVKAVDYEATAATDPSLHVAPDGSRKYYTIVVRATDAANGNASADTVLTIDLRDVNEAPTAPPSWTARRSRRSAGVPPTAPSSASWPPSIRRAARTSSMRSTPAAAVRRAATAMPAAASRSRTGS